MAFGDREDRNGRRGRFGGEREMHPAVCSDCGQQTEVPFKPTEGRPVYCRDCYQKHRRY
ncbi:MAG: CxxC-x17-CxxC domain-containing protein [Candidatus Micrarchaeia archaeon]